MVIAAMYDNVIHLEGDASEDHTGPRPMRPRTATAQWTGGGLQVLGSCGMRQTGFDAKAGPERRPAHRDREPERAIEMNLRPLAPEDCSCVDERRWAL